QHSACFLQLHEKVVPAQRNPSRLLQLVIQMSDNGGVRFEKRTPRQQTVGFRSFDQITYTLRCL
ncbi:MAG: hypothetical protein ACN4GK_00650, partial [Acidimicrobiia bacterium]